jgi:beta-glucosidase
MIDVRKVTEQIINQACRCILEMKYKLGLFNDSFRYCDENRLIARDIARRSLKADGCTYPLAQSNFSCWFISR